MNTKSSTLRPPFTTALDNGDILQHFPRALVLRFSNQRNVLSTAMLNGGYRRDLRAVFNFDEKKDASEFDCSELVQTYDEHLRSVARSFGLDPRYAAGLSTTADMSNAAICTESCGELSVTAIATAGIKENAGRAGDPASWDESASGSAVSPHGTINVCVCVGAALEEMTMVRAIVTCTEAKTAALQELDIGSRYSTGLATGTGTDGVIIVSDPASPIKLQWAGKHTKLGELIGLAVKEAVKLALFRQNGISAEAYRNAADRLARFGVEKTELAERFAAEGISGEKLERVLTDKAVLSASSLYAHLLDQLAWELLTAEDAEPMLALLLSSIGGKAVSISTDSTKTEALIDKWVRAIGNRCLTERE